MFKNRWNKELILVLGIVLTGAAHADDRCYANGKRYNHGTLINGDDGRKIQCDRGGWDSTKHQNNRKSSRSSQKYKSSSNDGPKYYNLPPGTSPSPTYTRRGTW